MYELTFLVEKETDSTVVKTILESFKGEIKHEKKWGKRTLAYPIKKKTEAFYFTWWIELDPQSVTDVRKKFNFSESVIRYLFITADEIPQEKKSATT